MMSKFFFCLMLITSFVYVNDALASKRPRDGDDGLDQNLASSKRTQPSLTPNGFDSLTKETIAYITGSLDPLTLSRFLLTNKVLGNVVRAQNYSYCIKPIPFGKELLNDITYNLNNKNYPMNCEMYLMEICQRLPYSFKSIFGAQVTMHNYLETLGKQRHFLESSWNQAFFSKEFNTVYVLRTLYRKITNPLDRESPEIDQDRRNFLEDTPERRQAITYMRPILLLGYLTDKLWCNFPSYNPKARVSQDSDIKDMLCIFHCYEASVDQRQLSLVPRIDFDLWNLNLYHSLWKAKVYHDAIGLDLNAKKQLPQKFRFNLQSSLSMLTAYWDSTLTFLPYESQKQLPLQHLSQTINFWLAEMLEMMREEHFSEVLTKDAFKTAIKRHINKKLYDLALPKVSFYSPHQLTVAHSQRLTFYCIQAATLAESNATKALFYKNAGDSKWQEAQLLSYRTDCQQKAAAVAESAQYFAEAACFSPNPAQKAKNYNWASIAKWTEADLLSEETDPHKKVAALAQFAHYSAESARIFNDADQKAQAYPNAGQAN